MKWYYESNGQPQGPIQEKELRQLKDEGRLMGDSLIWRQGMSDWAPLHSVSEFSSHPELAPPKVTALPRLNPMDGASGQAPYHKPLPELKGHAPQGRPSSSEDADGEDALRALSGDAGNLSGDAGPDLQPLGERPLPEWEHVRTVLPVREFIVTLREVLLEPKRTFSHFSLRGGWALPILFLLTAQILGNFLMISTLRQIPSILEQLLPMVRQLFRMDDVERAMSYLLTVSLFLLPLGVVLVSGVLHLALKLFGQSRQPFSTTFRTLCYTLGAGTMLWAIPFTAVSVASSSGEASAALFALFLGTNVMRLWSFYVSLRALSATHGVSLLRTTVSVLATLFCAGVVVPIIFGLLIASFKG